MVEYIDIQNKFYDRLRKVNELIKQEKDEEKRHILEGEMHIIEVMFIKSFRPDRPTGEYWKVYETYVKTYVPEAYEWFKEMIK